MFVNLCKAKIHRARVTEANLHYEGSLTVDPELLEAAGILVHERVQVLNHNNGARLETYIMLGERGSGTICLNGPAARAGQVGDIVTIIAYAWVPEEAARDWQPVIVFVDEQNRITEVRGERLPARGTAS